MPLLIAFLPLEMGISWRTMFAFSPDYPALLLVFAVFEPIIGGGRLSLFASRAQRRSQA